MLIKTTPTYPTTLTRGIFVKYDGQPKHRYNDTLFNQFTIRILPLFIVAKYFIYF